MPVQDPELYRRLASLESQVGSINTILGNMGVGSVLGVATPKPAYAGYNPGLVTPAAALFLSAGYSCPNDAQVTVKPFAGPEETRLTLVQGRGFSIDPTNGTIRYDRPKGEVGWIEFWAWISFAHNTSGKRRIVWQANDGSQAGREYSASSIDSGTSAEIEITHKRVVDADQTTYWLQAYQNRGGTLNINYALFTAIKIG